MKQSAILLINLVNEELASSKLVRIPPDRMLRNSMQLRNSSGDSRGSDPLRSSEAADRLGLHLIFSREDAPVEMSLSFKTPFQVVSNHRSIITNTSIQSYGSVHIQYINLKSSHLLCSEQSRQPCRIRGEVKNRGTWQSMRQISFLPDFTSSALSCFVESLDFLLYDFDHFPCMFPTYPIYIYTLEPTHTTD